MEPFKSCLLANSVTQIGTYILDDGRTNEPIAYQAVREHGNVNGGPDFRELSRVVSVVVVAEVNDAAGRVRLSQSKQRVDRTRRAEDITFFR